MYGLIKTANRYKQVAKQMRDAYDAEPALSDPELIELLTKLRDDYGVKAPYQRSTDYTDALFAPAEGIRRSPHAHQFGEDAREHGLILAPNKKMTLLHEAGHALDPESAKAQEINDLKQTAVNVSTLGGLATPIAANTISNHGKEEGEERKMTPGMAATGLVPLAAGGGLAYHASTKLNKLEDNANEFVKRFLTDELGDPVEVEKAIQNSSIPHGRKTYDLGRSALAKGTMIAGLPALAAGYAISHGLNAEHNKKVQ